MLGFRLENSVSLLVIVLILPCHLQLRKSMMFSFFTTNQWQAVLEKLALA